MAVKLQQLSYHALRMQDIRHGSQSCASNALSIPRKRPAASPVPAHRQLGQAGGPDRSWNSRFSRMQRLQTAGRKVAEYGADVGRGARLVLVQQGRFPPRPDAAARQWLLKRRRGCVDWLATSIVCSVQSEMAHPAQSLYSHECPQLRSSRGQSNRAPQMAQLAASMSRVVAADASSAVPSPLRPAMLAACR